MDNNHFYAFFLDNEKRSGWMRCDIFCSEAEEEYFLAEEIFLGESGLYPGQTMVYLFDLGGDVLIKFDVTLLRIDTRKNFPSTSETVGEKREIFWI